jgi:hypothetical protein
MSIMCYYSNNVTSIYIRVSISLKEEIMLMLLLHVGMLFVDMIFRFAR